MLIVFGFALLLSHLLSFFLIFLIFLHHIIVFVFSQNHPPLAPREHRTSVAGAGGSGQQAAAPPPMGLAVLDAFTQVAEVLEEARRQHSALATAIEDMPSFGNVLTASLCYHCWIFFLFNIFSGKIGEKL